MGKRQTRGNRDGTLDVEILRTGVLLSAHQARHRPAGADPLPVGVPSSTAVYGGANAEGNAEVYARQNHVHACTRQFFVPYNGKIADITHADTNKHTLTLANPAGTGAITGETRKIISIIIASERMAGTGVFYAYPNEGARNLNKPYQDKWEGEVVIADGTNRLQYALSVANDDFDLYCMRYVVEA